MLTCFIWQACLFLNDKVASCLPETRQVVTVCCRYRQSLRDFKAPAHPILQLFQAVMVMIKCYDERHRGFSDQFLLFNFIEKASHQKCQQNLFYLNNITIQSKQNIEMNRQ